MDGVIKSFTQSELAKALDINQGIIAMAIKRGNLIIVDKKIHLDKPTNELWFQKQLSLGKTFDVNRIYKKAAKIEKIKKEKVENQEVVKEDKPIKLPAIDKGGLIDLEIRKKELDIDRLQKTIRLDEIRIHKLEGQLLPYDATANVFLFAIETFRASFLQEVKSIANVFVQRLGGEQKHFIELQKELSLKVEEVYVQSKEEIISGLENIVDEYKEVRARGERK